MLSVLKIKNLALVDQLTWEMGPGLVTVTGETGAGKSIIVGALKLILGERADRSLIRTGESDCTVEAVFELTNRDAVNAILEEAGLDPCEDNQLVLKRSFTASGSNRQFINCSPSTLAVLKTLGVVLVDLHGPHDHQSLLSRDRQLSMLDAYAGCEAALTDYQTAWEAWREALRNYEALRDAEEASEQELELLRHQVEEIQSAELRPNEEAELEQQYSVASNSQRLLDIVQTAVSKLGDGPMNVQGQLTDLQKSMRDLERIDDSASHLVEQFEGVRVELEDLAINLQDYASGVETDPSEVSLLEERLDLIQSLKRKYGTTLETVMEFGQEATRKLHAIEGRGEELASLNQRVQEARAAMDEKGSLLSEQRGEAAPRLAAEVSRHLADLGFRQARFEVDLTDLTEPASHGPEEVEFQFAPNPGEPWKPLRVIASSGEMSRVMLAVKNALADQDDIPLMVFDEIDANVGGEIAHAVGHKMNALGDKHQVVAITHMPQVASISDQHFVVTKEVVEEKTRSTLVPVSGDRRIEEITRMLGGGGDSARALAESLLSR